MMEVVLDFSIEKLNLLIAMQDSKTKIIIQDIYLSTVLIFLCTLSSHWFQYEYTLITDNWYYLKTQKKKMA